MYAFITKEIRQNVLWVFIAAIVMAITFGFVLSVNSGRAGSIVDINFMLTEGLFFCNGGLALGIALILADTYRGKWGFIVTRPISRTKIFFAKLIAGIILYLIATTISIGVITLLSMNIYFVRAPFAWNFLIPSLFLQLTGIAFMSAGMLVGARRAAWLGSRLFPVATAVAGVMLTFATLIFFGESILVVTGIFILITISAVAYFVHNGEYEPQHKLVKPIQFVIIGIGSGLLVIVLCGAASMIRDIFHETPRENVSYGYYPVFDKQGNAYFAQSSPTGEDHYFDLNLKPLDKEKEASVSLSKNRLSMSYQFWIDPDDVRYPRTARLSDERFFYPQKYLSMIHQSEVYDQWIYVAQKGLIYGINHDGKPIGVIGTNGWQLDDKSATPIEGKLTFGYEGILTTDRAVYVLDFKKKTIMQIYRAADDEKIQSTALFTTNQVDGVGADGQANGYLYTRHDKSYASAYFDKNRYLSIITSNQLKVFTNQGEEKLSLDLDPKWKRQINVGGGKDGIFFVSNYESNNPTITQQLFRVNSSGQVLSSTTIPSHNVNDFQSYERIPDLIPLTSIPSLLVIIAWLWDGPIHLAGSEWMVFLGCLSIVLLIMSLMIRRYRMTRFQAILWLIFAAALGVTALLTLYFLKQKPIQIACPSCGRRRMICDAVCPHCQKRLVSPSEPEIEIFDLPLKIA